MQAEIIQEKIELSSIYCMKAIGAIFVLLIHFGLYGVHILGPVYKTGVLVFFIIGGYFLYTDDWNKFKLKIKKQSLKLLKLNLFVNSVYLVLFYLASGELKISSVHDMILFILHGSNICFHLWFLNAYLWGILIFMALVKIFKHDWILGAIGLLFWLLSISLNAYLKFLPDDYIASLKPYDNWIAMCIPLLILGYLIHKHSYKVSRRKGSVLIVISILMAFIENRLLVHYEFFNGGVLLVAPCIAASMLIYCISNPNIGKDTILATIGKRHSANYYYWQFIPVVFFPDLIYITYGKFSFLIVLGFLIPWSYLCNSIARQITKVNYGNI